MVVCVVIPGGVCGWQLGKGGQKMAGREMKFE